MGFVRRERRMAVWPVFEREVDPVGGGVDGYGVGAVGEVSPPDGSGDVVGGVEDGDIAAFGRDVEAVQRGVVPEHVGCGTDGGAGDLGALSRSTVIRRAFDSQATQARSAVGSR